MISTNLLAKIFEKKESFFLYNLDALKEHLDSLEIHHNREEGLHLFYALKANPHPAIIKAMANAGMGLDTASIGEMNLALQGIVQGRDQTSKTQLISTGPCKSLEFLDLAAQNKAMVVVESFSQLRKLNALKKPVNALLRFQLGPTKSELDEKQNQNEDRSEDNQFSVLGGKEITPFGLEPSQWLEFRVSDYPYVTVYGAHCFQWGNILEENQLKKIWETTATEAVKLFDQLRLPLQILDFGGGLGLNYDQKDSEDSYHPFTLNFSKLSTLLKEIKKQFQIPQIWLELGRFAIGPFGDYYTMVEDVKKVRGVDLVITRGGINHLARVALTGQSFPMEHLSLPLALPLIASPIQKNDFKFSYQVHGPLCTGLDKLGIVKSDKEIQEGDWIKHHFCGAYGMTEAMPLFLCHEFAKEYCLMNGKLD